MDYILLWVLGAIVLVAIWALNSRWLADRGWIYNRHNPCPKGGGTLGLLEEIYQPSIRHVVEERASEKARGNQDAKGEDE